MNNNFGYYNRVGNRLMCFATEAEYYEYISSDEPENNIQFEDEQNQPKSNK